MSAGQKIQAALKKVHVKLGLQDGDIIFRKVIKTVGDKFGKPYTATSVVDMTIKEGIKIEFVKSYDTDSAGTIKLGDLKLTVPGGLIAEEGFTGAVVIYKGETYSIQRVQQKSILSGVVTAWIVFVRLKKG